MTNMISRPTDGSPTPITDSSDAPNSRQANGRPSPNYLSPAGPDSPAPNECPTTNWSAAREPKPADGHIRFDARDTGAVGANLSGRRIPNDTHVSFAAGSYSPDRAAVNAPQPINRSLLDPALSFAADILDDIERVKIANANRLRQMTRSVEDSDGEVRGFGFDESHPDVARLAAMVETLGKVEHDAVLGLQRQLRRHPLHAWVKAQRGVGEKQGARLLAAIGDPYVRPEWTRPDGEVLPAGPRTVSALWAYCGLHVLPGSHVEPDTRSPSAAGSQPSNTDRGTPDALMTLVGVAARRRKGQRANWSNNAKMRAYLIAESCIKQLDAQCRDGHTARDVHGSGAAPACACSPYRVVYDTRRAHTALTRPDWTDGHSHNDALRVASKTILRDLWRAAREWHLAQGVTP